MPVGANSRHGCLKRPPRKACVRERLPRVSMLATPLHAVLALACAWLLVGALGLLRAGSTTWATRFLYPAGAVVGLGLSAVALLAIFEPVTSLVLPLGLPDLPFHARLDALSAFF